MAGCARQFIEAKGALPPSALRLPPPRSPRGRGAGRAAYGLLTYPPALSVWSFQQRQGCGLRPVILTRSVLSRYAPCAPHAASGAALDPASTQVLNGKGVKGTVEYRRAKPEDMPRKSLDALGVTHASGWGVGCAGRRPELPAPLTTEGDSFPPAGGGGGRLQRP